MCESNFSLKLAIEIAFFRGKKYFHENGSFFFLTSTDSYLNWFGSCFLIRSTVLPVSFQWMTLLTSAALCVFVCVVYRRDSCWAQMCNSAEYSAIHSHTNTLKRTGTQMRGCSVEASDHILHVSAPEILKPPRLFPYAHSATFGFKHCKRVAEKLTTDWVFNVVFLLFGARESIWASFWGYFPFLSEDCLVMLAAWNDARLCSWVFYSPVVHLGACTWKTLSKVLVSSLERHNVSSFFLLRLSICQHQRDPCWQLKALLCWG